MMPLYEGIALIQEKQPVVLDLGYDYTKFGFGGEPSPRCIIPSEFWCNVERKLKRVFDYKTDEELYENLVQMLHLLYFKYILVNPKERKVIVVESLFTPTRFRETLAKVLFLHYEVTAVVWADAPRVCALTLGTSHALVVDIGARDAEIVPVVYGIAILKAVQSVPLAGRHIASQLHKLIQQDNDPPPALDSKHLHDIIAKCCFVGSRERCVKWHEAITDPSKAPTPAKDVLYPYNGATIKISGRARELAAKDLFARDNEMTSIPDMILQAILMSPVDLRRQLAENILITGGVATLPGLKHRLSEELKYLITQPPYCNHLYTKSFKYHSPPSHLNSCAWLGASLADSFVWPSSITRDNYLKDGRLGDWISLLTNTPKNHYFYVEYENDSKNL